MPAIELTPEEEAGEAWSYFQAMGRSLGFEDVACGWFALCDHPATHVRSHPIFDWVPICDRCEAKLAKIGASDG